MVRIVVRRAKVRETMTEAPLGGYLTHTQAEAGQGKPGGSDVVWDLKVPNSKAGLSG